MKTQKKLWSALAALCVATVTVAQPAYDYSKLQKEQLGRVRLPDTPFCQHKHGKIAKNVKNCLYFFCAVLY